MELNKGEKTWVLKKEWRAVGTGVGASWMSSLRPQGYVIVPTTFFLHRMFLSFHNIALSPSPPRLLWRFYAQQYASTIHVLNLLLKKKLTLCSFFSTLLPLRSTTTSRIITHLFIFSDLQPLSWDTASTKYMITFIYIGGSRRY